MFILCEPKVPENIGASARAINTMGFSKLRLVNPKTFPNPKANWVAHGSEHILEDAEIFNDISSALEDVDFSIATSAKSRSVKTEYTNADDLPFILENKIRVLHKVALVFGGEESGLTNEDLQKCDIVSYLSMSKPYPSLNLSQAVMLYAYILSSISKEGETAVSHNNSTQSYKILKDKVLAILEDLEIHKKPALYGRFNERIGYINENEIDLLHSLCNSYIEKYMYNKQVK